MEGHRKETDVSNHIIIESRSAYNGTVHQQPGNNHETINISFREHSKQNNPYLNATF